MSKNMMFFDVNKFMSNFLLSPCSILAVGELIAFLT